MAKPNDAKRPGAASRTKPDAPIEPRRKGKTLTQDEKVDEASRESMDASDAPGYLPLRTGEPKEPAKK